MKPEEKNSDYLPNSKERIRVFNLIDKSCELAVQKGPHDLDPDCQCLACMTKRKKILYPIPTKMKFRL